MKRRIPVFILISVLLTLVLTVCAGAAEVKFTTSDGAKGDEFGYSAPMSGGYASVGAYDDNDSGSNSGAVYAHNILIKPPANPTNLENITGNYWVNYTWQAGNGKVIDSYNVNMNDTWTNGTAATFLNTSVGEGGWANITVWGWRASGNGKLLAGCVSDEVQAPSAPAAAPNIRSIAPPTPVSNTAGEIRTFDITIDQIANVTWYLNGTNVQDTNTSVTAANYTNTDAEIGVWNLSARAENANGTDMRTWVWNVVATVPPTPPCDCGDICVNISGWWRNNNTFNANTTTPIQAAVDDATAGETICVWAGDYNENVDVTKRVTLTCASVGVVTVTAASPSDHVFEVTADCVNISGFRMIGATGAGKAGIYLTGVQHCNISDNTANSNNYGIFLRSSSSNTLRRNTANSNRDCGIGLHSSSSNTLLRNTANSNDKLGIGIYSSSSNTLLRNTANSNYYGIGLHSSSNNLIYNNYFDNTNNAYDNGNNIWNTTPTEGTNAIGRSWLGGNYWSDYAGVDMTGDGLGDTLTPYNSAGNIDNVGDCHPLVPPGIATPSITSRGNNITNDGSASININEAVAVCFNATADQTIATWNWNNDGTLVRSNNFDNYTTYWDVSGTHIVSLNVKNANGVSGTKTWTVTVQSSSGVATIAIGDASDNETIPIVVENGVNVGAFDITLSFNASVVKVTDVADGDFDITIPNVVHVREGLVRIGAFQTGNSGLNGRITLAKVTFTSMRHPKGTESPLNLCVTTFKDATPAGDEMPYIIRNGNYTTIINGDINGGGVVDFQDAAFLAKHVVGIPGFENITEGTADVDGNDLIDLADVVYLVRHLLGVSGYEELR